MAPDEVKVYVLVPPEQVKPFGAVAVVTFVADEYSSSHRSS
jgi:hypothetical protein